MNIDEFVSGIRQGKIKARSGGIDEEGNAVDSDTAVDMNSIESITAEAFRYEVFDTDTSWEEAMKLVSEALSGRK